VTDADRQHLAAILGMLGSEHAGERATAVLKAEAFRRKHGMTWEELIQGKHIIIPRVVYVDREVTVERMVPIYSEPSPWIDRLLITFLFSIFPIGIVLVALFR
jgi:hypothetical protein